MKRLLTALFMMLLLPMTSVAAELTVEVDLKDKIAQIDSAITFKEREITFNKAELIGLEIDPSSEEEKKSHQERLRLANEILENQIQDMQGEKAQIMQQIVNTRRQRQAQLMLLD